MSLDKVLECLSTRKARVLELHQGLTKHIAMSPDSGGDGEWAKAEWLKNKMRSFGLIEIEEYNAPDERVSAKQRPNFTVTVKGKSSKALWVIGHLDVVPAGAKELWTTEPFQATLGKDEDTLYGRGVEDNQQGIVAATILAAELVEQQLIPELTLKILCVSDEETSNKYGIDYLMENFPDLVAKDDLVVVPDFGTPDGTMIEVAEKGVLWLEVVLSGKQCHASTPAEGINTLMVAAEMISSTQKIEQVLSNKNDLFIPNYSTITPTRILENVPNINTISGRDTFYIDCRFIPTYTDVQVLDMVKLTFQPIADKYGAKLEINVVNKEPAAPVTPSDSEVVVKMQKAIKSVYNIDTTTGGIGGSTVASRFRLKGIPAVVWARVHPSYHEPNEHGKISHNINDAKVYAKMLFE